MPPYHVRAAALDDIRTLVAHRLAMFAEMGYQLDADAVGRAFADWVSREMPAGNYHAWLIEADGAQVVAGGGITVLPWPPGPEYLTGRVAYVYNVYTVPMWRHRGLATLVMDTIHGWCRDHGIGLVGLNASAAGQPVYESMGYRATGSPMMWAALGL
jgi:GNAT superfamily N-acetyltransferase